MRFSKNHRKSSRFFCKNEGASNKGMSKSEVGREHTKGIGHIRGIV